MTYSPRRPLGRRGLLSDSWQSVGHFLSFEGRDAPPPFGCASCLRRETLSQHWTYPVFYISRRVVVTAVACTT
ncbi:hypothetical protein [Komarekiella delphini-convector]|uniref:hypothetical protein n=1 Tax=Komarekiella delphini-convector TaxID=3050158 RepID=UPI001781B703|nr:hypothetical protein [Komarekiella delphini-convector]